MKILKAILKAAELIIKVVQWIITNGIPFVRGIIEEIKTLKEKKK